MICICLQCAGPRNWSLDSLKLTEEAEINGISHGSIAGVFGVQVVAAVVLRRKNEGVGRIAGGLVEVDGAVEDT